ncbi:hypothetical protein ACFL0Q_07975, partial [Thermodesulfobacteriota bacterium]
PPYTTIDYISHLGQNKLAFQVTSDLLEMIKGSSDIFVTGTACFAHGFSLYHKGSFEEAKKYLEDATPVLERIEFITYWSGAYEVLGDVYVQMGDYETAKSSFSNSIEILRNGGISQSNIKLLKIELALAKLLNNEEDVTLSEVLKYYENIKRRLEGVRGRLAMAEIALRLDDQHLPDARQWIDKAIEGFEESRMKWFLGRTHSLSAEYFKRKGDQPKAREHLSKAIDIMKECGADGWVTRYEEELAKM